MDLTALINGGRLQEAIARIQQNLQPGDWGSLSNLAVCYRRLGDKQSELRYAFDAYLVAPLNPAVLNTFFRALANSGQHALAARIYNSIAPEMELNRDIHLCGLHANLRIHRTDPAAAALRRASPFNDANAADLKAQHAFARALSDEDIALDLLSKMEKLGQVVTNRQIIELYEYGRFQECVDAFAATENDEIRQQSAKAAYLSAILIDDFTAANLAARYGITNGIRRFGDFAQRSEKYVTIKGETRSYQFPFRPKNLSLAIPHANGRFYEQHQLIQLAQCLPSQPTVIDIGANIGNHTVFLAGELGARVTPFECNPILLPALKEVIAINGLDQSVNTSFLGSAVTSFCGTIGFDFRREDFSSVTNDSGAGASEVPCLSIDSLNLERIDLLKVDVDGGEIGVLQGVQDTLKRLRPLVAIEIMNWNIKEALDLLFARDYAILYEDIRADTHSDFILAPRENYLKLKFY